MNPFLAVPTPLCDMHQAPPPLKGAEVHVERVWDEQPCVVCGMPTRVLVRTVFPRAGPGAEAHARQTMYEAAFA